MDINVIKKLREMTGLPLTDIKAELIKNNGDYEQTLARLKTLIKPQEKNKRVASKGMVSLQIKDNRAVLLEITAETDFARKNAHFIKLFDDVFDLLMQHDYNDLDHLLKANIAGKTLEHHVNIIATLVSENISIRRFDVINKDMNHQFGSYLHSDGKSACVVVIDKDDQSLAKMIAMQAVAMDALMIDYQNLSKESFESLKKAYLLFKDQFDTFETFLKSKSLLDQPYIHDQDQSVRSILNKDHVHIMSLIRYSLGEGIKDKLMCRLDLSSPSKISVAPILKT